MTCITLRLDIESDIEAAATFFFAYPLLVWYLVKAELLIFALLLGLAASVFAFRSYLRKKPMFFGCTLIVLSIMYWILPIHAERIYPWLMSVWVLSLTSIKVLKDQQSLLLPTIERFKLLNEYEKRRVKQSETAWLLFLCCNTLILSYFLFDGALHAWALYSGVIFYILLVVGILMTMLYTHGVKFFVDAFARGLSILNHIQAFSLFGLMCLLFLPVIVIMLTLDRFRFSYPYQMRIRTICYYSFRFLKFYTRQVKMISWRFQYLTPPEATSQLLVCNHICLFDIVSIFSEFKNCNTFVNQKFLKNPLLTPIIRSAGYIPVDGQHKEKNSISYEKISMAFQEQNKIAVFPEGTRSSSGALGVLQNGAFRLALEHGVDITPVFFTIDFPFLNKKQLFSQQLRGVNLIAYVLPKIDVRKYPDHKEGVRQLKMEYKSVYDKFILDYPIIGGVKTKVNHAEF